MSDLIQFRKGTTAQWAAANPVLASGEPGLDTTTGDFKVGDGVTVWLLLAGRYAPPQRMGAAVVTSNQTGITAIVDLTGFAIGFTVLAGHVYEASWTLQLQQNTAAANPLFKLSDGAVDLGFVGSMSAAIAQVITFSGSVEVPGLSAGSHTLKLRGQTTAGTMDIQNSGVNGRFSVKDLGV